MRAAAAAAAEERLRDWRTLWPLWDDTRMDRRRQQPARRPTEQPTRPHRCCRAGTYRATANAGLRQPVPTGVGYTPATTGLVWLVSVAYSPWYRTARPGQPTQPVSLAGLRGLLPMVPDSAARSADPARRPADRGGRSRRQRGRGGGGEEEAVVAARRPRIDQPDWLSCSRPAGLQSEARRR